MIKILLDERVLQKASNHPVHILNSKGDFSPSAFIPFCIFGNKKIGEKINDFEVPVCNIFVAKNWNDQVCYELDLSLLKDEGDINHQLKDGILLILDFNEERQFEKDKNSEKVEEERKILFEEEENTVQVHIDSIQPPTANLAAHDFNCNSLQNNNRMKNKGCSQKFRKFS